MDIVRAKEIITILADGINPLTGEVLPKEDSCNQVEVVRALHAVLDYINTMGPTNNKVKKAQPENAGKPWSDAEKNAVAEEYHSGMKISEIAQAHKRTRGSIEAKLAQLGLIDYSYYTGKMG